MAIAVPCQVPLAIVPVVTKLESPGYAVASERLNAGVVSLAPSATVTPPKFTVEFARYAFAMAVPCHAPLVIVPVVTKLESPGYAVASLRLKAGVVSDAPSANETPP